MATAGTVTVDVEVRYVGPNICPGCGRCRECGQPAPITPYPIYPTYPVLPPTVAPTVDPYYPQVWC